MHPERYTVEDFLTNDSFINYCFKSNESDIAFWEEWIKSHPEKQAEFSEAKSLFVSMSIQLSETEKEEEFGKLQQAIREINRNSQKRSVQLKPISILQRVAAVAAIVVLSIGGIWLVREFSSKTYTATTAHFTTYASAKGERKTVKLPDGTSVILNSNSSISISDNFNALKREVNLKGEALFDVAHNKQKPFIVAAGNLKVQALGTSFKVRQYDFDKQLKVSLLEGKVRVSQQLKDESKMEVILHPGEAVYLNTDSPELRKQSFDLNAETNWKEGKLIFKDASVAQIATQLEYWYGVKIVPPSNIKKSVRFNGEFINKKPEEVLAAIAYVTHLKYEVKNNTIMLTNKN